ncbi:MULTISPECIES: NAD(P)/FAD-dependent oxidoreductase [unclassified Bifidobacterium]|uniref:dihydrolipoyl dehydrogenase family protein n=1 Tax=unclassified Bifidobacterium TaxID=2608897 RepID=UPI00112950EE|nr:MULTISPECIES: FAD-dependent oxidoreductase [unclassified Bifidobacterium]TPF79133.1 dihydrolipoamide dehydrogenase [Bifidobacterium sp. UTCIF-1]TPF81004.1 dihydrolipoamide dehydrogenase [Bifidobacterium sp. UTCIF-24]TPF83199.1 dihydrolipoamide dehydrogenase [Bifidobacterium sp. UTCIF-3]TPF85040.1 dihydrolipoamide dehydrogenase [Bifidobacterium sp. UTCIF-36]TPF90324.1 dihydrolipoamide dehydrogenase [Bifidobacterium sp. UTBIF-56]
MSEQYDIAIIGAGPGGYSTALRAAELGKKVALIERDATVGGTCLNRGCIPSKALITATHTIDTVHRAAELGVQATVDGIDFGKLHDYRRHIVDTMVQGLSGLLAHRGITVYRGFATFAADETDTGGRHIVHIAPAPQQNEVIVYHKANVPKPAGTALDLSVTDIVIATGARPRPLPGNPFGGALIDSTQALEANEFPSSAVIIGAGAVALEFASMWNAAGSDITLLIRKDRVLSAWDRRAGVTLTRELKRHGIKVITHSTVTHVDVGVNLGATVHYTVQGEDGEHSVWGEVALAAIGRDPITDSSWGVALTSDGLVSTDAFGHTDKPGIWAVGDVTEGHALAHRAFEQGLVIAETIAGQHVKPVEEDTIPQVVFSSPEAACVGLTLNEAQAREDLVEVKETAYPMLSNARMLMRGTAGSMTIVSGCDQSAPDAPRILGVHIVSPLASDLIAEAEQLVGNHIPLSEAARLIHPHPTFSETLGEALLKADGRPLHTR